MNRRSFLKLSAGAAALLAGKTWAQNNPTESIRQAAQAFLQSLGASRGQAQFALNSERRLDWHWFPTWSREGVLLKEMTPSQQQAALALLRSSSSPSGYTKALEIMALQRDLGRDAGDYYFSVYGNPTDNAWAWGVEGHHLSLNYTIAAQQVAAAPLFLGASPTYAGSNRRPTMRREEEAVRELVRSLGAAERSRVIVGQRTPGDTLSRNAIKVQPLEASGLPLGQLTATQQGLALEAIREYLSAMPASVGATRLQQLQAELPNARLTWLGSTEPRQLHYYRIQGQSFLLEHDNSRDGGTHIHSVWRDFAADFGANLL